MFVKQSEIRAAAKAAGKKVGKDFLQAVEDAVTLKITQAIADHNGGRKTLDSAVAKMAFGIK